MVEDLGDVREIDRARAAWQWRFEREEKERVRKQFQAWSGLEPPFNPSLLEIDDLTEKSVRLLRPAFTEFVEMRVDHFLDLRLVAICVEADRRECEAAIASAVEALKGAFRCTACWDDEQLLRLRDDLVREAFVRLRKRLCGA